MKRLLETTKFGFHATGIYRG